MSKQFVEECESLSEKFDALEKIRQADLSTLLECLAEPSTPGRFISRVFHHYHGLGETSYKLIGKHQNTPRLILALFSVMKPEWLEGSAAMSRVQLSFMETQEKVRWDKMVAGMERNPFYSTIDDLYERDYEALGAHYGGYSYWDVNEALMREVMSRCPSFIIDYYLSNGTIDDVAYIASLCNIEVLAKGEQHKNFRVRKFIAELEHLPPALAKALAQDKTSSVRKAVAFNETTPNEVMLLLAKDKDAKVVDVLLKNKNLQNSLKKEIIDSRQSSVDSETKDDDLSNTLNLLRTQPLAEDTLLKLCDHPIPFIRAAAGYHPSATEKVFDALMKEEQPWLKGGVAMCSTQTKHLSSLSQAKDFDIDFGLACNESTPQEDVLSILERCKEDAVRLQIANTFFDDEEIINKIISRSLSVTDWEGRLSIVLDPETKSSKLLHIHRSREWRHMALSKAIARHPNCPKSLHGTYGFYLPQELSKNPAFILQALESMALPEEEYLDWKINQQMMDRCAHEFINNYYIEQESHARRVISGNFFDISKVIHFALSEDGRTAQRFVSNYPNRFTLYIYNALVFHPNAATRKHLASNKYVTDDIILSLANDKDKAVQMAAAKAAKARNLIVNVEINKTSLKSLGNKQARLDLAKSSKDIEILNMLAQDKTRDVREVIATRSGISDESFLLLAQDNDSIVAHAALLHGENRPLLQDQANKLDSIAVHFIRDDKVDSHTRATVVKTIRNLSFLKQFFPSNDSKIDREITKWCNQPEIFKQALFMDQQRGGKPNLAYSLLGNPHLTIDQLDQIVLAFDNMKEPRLSKIRSPEAVIAILKRGFGASHFETIYADLSVDQIMEVLNISISHVSMLRYQLKKLSKEQMIKLIKSEKTFRRTIAHSNVDSKEITNLLYSDFGDDTKVMCGLAYHKLMADQIQALVDHEDEKVRQAITCNEKLTTEQALTLAKDSSVEVRRGLFYNCYDDERLAVEVLMQLAHDNDRDISSEAKDILKERGIKVEEKVKTATLSMTDALKTFNAPFGAIKANKKLLAIGILEEGERESSSKPGTFKKFKRLSKKGEQYGVNKYNQYGDATPYYHQNSFGELLKMMLANEV